MIYAGFIGRRYAEKSLFPLERYFRKRGLSFNVHKLGAVTLYVSEPTSPSDHDSCVCNKDSALLGRAFDKKTYQRVENLDAYPDDYYTQIFDHIWGKFISINVRSDRVLISQDPAGQLDFFYTRSAEGGFFFASSIELLHTLQNQEISYDWNYLCNYVAKGWLNTVYTPFQGYYELPSGCQLSIDMEDGATAINPIWTLKPSGSSQTITETEIVDTISKVLKNWLAGYDEILLELSGGVDSTSLLCLLSEVLTEKQKLKAINFSHAQVSSSNEVHYAESVCDQLNVPLEKISLGKDLPFERYSGLPFKPSKPSSSLTHMRAERRLQNIARSDNHIFVSGHGGDHIFLCPAVVSSAADAFLEIGLRAGLQKAHELSDYFRMPFWRPCLDMFKKYAAQKMHIDKVNFLKDSTSEEERLRWRADKFDKVRTDSCLHPLLASVKTTEYLPGKYDQLCAVLELFPTLDICLRSQHNPIFYPLAYSPVVELAYQIPTYRLFQKGYDRYPFRKAIHDRFKVPNIWRKDKGETTGVMQLGFQANLQRIKELALEGGFARQGLIKKDILAQQIEDYAAGEVIDIWPILQLLSAEIFFECWETT